MPQKNKPKKYLRKTIEIEENTWEFLQFLKNVKKHDSLKSLIEEIFEDVRIEEEELFKLFEKKKIIDAKIEKKLTEK